MLTLYTISEFANLCGVSATTLRAWQRRYGLLKPERTEGGHRLYSQSDLKRVLSVLDWIKKGVPVSQIKPLLESDHNQTNNNWQQLQEKILLLLQQGKIDALRQLLFACGRDYPRSYLVDHVLRPLRVLIAANTAPMLTLRTILDSLIIGYTSFCLDADKRSRGEKYILVGWKLSDPAEIWLEALKLSGAGKRIEVLAWPCTLLAPELFPDYHWILLTSTKLTALEEKQCEVWRNYVLSLQVALLR
ncbi:MerR family transcriptional regulator [Serratia sp. DD3]|uniref:MerR family transcriptional regulator n=1 Tax=Serratia sp. DD3 TaxID=1410619 RepID=UPI0004D8A86B|nr:MerR family transcriptional regulator [Serratia sp. DD3]KEY59735.1 HTH-type transcriptional repressor YcgE [Serratia sp. DD3]